MSNKDIDQQPVQIRIRPMTRARLDRIRHEAGWTIVEAVDRAVTELEKRVTPQAHGRKRTPSPSAA